jgi:hypothetical protein
MKPVPPDTSLFLTTLKNKINVHYTCGLHLYRRQSGRGTLTPNSRNRNPQYCFLSEEQNPDRKNQQQILVFVCQGPHSTLGSVGALSVARLLERNVGKYTEEEISSESVHGASFCSLHWNVWDDLRVFFLQLIC